jgi:beta-lactamase regulating signal transducer with metallopeptidase domain
MIPQVVLQNFHSWMTQVFLIGSVGALLPSAFRIRHPRSQLVYCHLVLLVCLAVPVLQSWHHPVVVLGEAQQTASQSTESAVIASPVAQTTVPWEQLMILLIVSGMIARLSWTVLGLLRIDRHRLAAAPLYPVPEIVHDASKRIGASATFCVSTRGLGPVTFGFIRPVVLLPKSLFSMSEAAQRSVLCHELLHVKRRDWLITVAEEVIGAVFWFHPAVWWLLGQARLSREQLVDAEVVRAISDREPYIDALLTMSGVQRGLDLVPAPLFLRRRHLLQRMHLLVSEISMSKARLLSSYTLIAGILSTAAWLAFVSFPLIGHAEVRETARAEAQSQNPPGYVVNIQPLSYPQEAIDKKIEGAVVVELSFNAAGDIIDSHVISGPEELRKTALESALKGTYSINVVLCKYSNCLKTFAESDWAQLTKFGLAWNWPPILQSCYFISNSVDLVHIFVMEEIVSG